MSINIYIKNIYTENIYTEVLLSHEKEGNPPTCDNKDGFQGHYAKWDKSDRERQISYHLNVESKKTTFMKMESKMLVNRGYRLGKWERCCLNTS